MNVHSPPQSDHALIRAHFAAEEQLTAETANRAYSDRKLDMVRDADPKLYQEWLEKARLAANS